MGNFQSVSVSHYDYDHYYRICIICDARLLLSDALMYSVTG